MKPVAWIIQSKYGFPALVWNGEPIKYNAISVKQDDIPLYTAPRELSDEEIYKLAEKIYGHGIGLYDHIGFARAILKKASEK